MLLEQIKKDTLEARKSRSDAVAVSLLTTLLSDIAMSGKNENRESDDNDAKEVIRRFLKNVNFTLEKRPGDPTATKEKEILSAYLPKQPTENELANAVKELIAELPEKNVKAMGRVMGGLKSKYGQDFDANKASKIVKEFLA